MKTPTVVWYFDILCDQLSINISSAHSECSMCDVDTQPPPLYLLSDEERQHPVHLRCGRQGEGGADHWRRSAVRRPVAHAPAGQERLSHGAPGRRQPLQGHPARHPGLWRSQRFNLLPWRDPTRSCPAENCSR